MVNKIIGDVFTVNREITAGSGYAYYLSGLSQGLALLNMIENAEFENRKNGIITQKFTFICLECGMATYQFAKFRVFDPKDILLENAVTVYIGMENTGNNREGWGNFQHSEANDLKKA